MSKKEYDHVFVSNLVKMYIGPHSKTVLTTGAPTSFHDSVSLV